MTAPAHAPGLKRLFFSQLRLLLKSGLPLDRALATMGEGGQFAGLGPAARELAGRVREGAPLSAEMRARPDVFAAHEADVIELGEQAGNLVPPLDRLIGLSDLEREFHGDTHLSRNFLRFNLAVALAVFLVLNFFISPVFARMFSDMGLTERHLPHLTSLTFNFNHWLVVGHGWWWILGPLAAWALLSRLVLPALVPNYHRRRESLLLNIPELGDQAVANDCYHFFARAALLLDAGLALPRSLELASESVGIGYLREKLRAAAGSVAEGMSPPIAFKRVRKFPTRLIALLEASAAQGDVPEGVRAIGTYARELKPLDVTRISAIMALVAVLLLTAGMVISLYLPIFSAASNWGH